MDILPSSIEKCILGEKPSYNHQIIACIIYCLHTTFNHYHNLWKNTLTDSLNFHISHQFLHYYMNCLSIIKTVLLLMFFSVRNAWYNGFLNSLCFQVIIYPKLHVSDHISLTQSHLLIFHGQRSLVGYSPCGHKESDMTGWLTLSYVCMYTDIYPCGYIHSPQYKYWMHAM